MLDRWIVGEANRMSPEAPVPVLLETNQEYSIGGAGNLALNIKSLGSQVELTSALGNDKEGYKLLELVEASKLEVTIAQDHKITTTKTRLVGQRGQHIVRWDRELPYVGDVATRFNNNVKKHDIICISDYAKGTVRRDTVANLLSKEVKILVDPKQDANFYHGAYLVKPNMAEYEAWFGKWNQADALRQMQRHSWTWLVVTDGANGMHVLNILDEYKHFVEPVKEVADVTGAGDTVMAVIAYGIDSGMDIFDACKLACYAAARIVEKRGVAIIQQDDLERNIVWTNGVFDILHTGHLKLLRHAHTLGKRLVVGINSDSSVKRLKGDLRPINDQNTRKEALLELGFVDDVVIFEQDTPYEAIKEIQPDVIVKGGDYTVEQVVGNDIAKVEIFPTVKGYSTTKTIERMKA
jgi:D-beta-D-heptose 7-phosphate kinase/D-beta-D-heptose 1-phosphate adenosyltransferase